MAKGLTYRAVKPRDPYAEERRRYGSTGHSGAPEPEYGETERAERLREDRLWATPEGASEGASYGFEHLKRKKSSAFFDGASEKTTERRKSSGSGNANRPAGYDTRGKNSSVLAPDSVDAGELLIAAQQVMAPENVLSSAPAALMQANGVNANSSGGNGVNANSSGGSSQTGSGSGSGANTNSDSNASSSGANANANSDPNANASAANSGSSAGAAASAANAEAGSGSYDIDRGISNLYSALYKKLKAYGVTGIPDFNALYAMFESFLRPSIDAAIKARRRSGRTSMAELDADAYARGMGSSSYLSSVKAREHDAVESDVTGLEGKYSSSMSEYLYKAVSSMQELESEMTRKKMELVEQAKARAEQRRFEREKLEAQQRENARLQKEKLEAERLMAEMNNKTKMELEKEKNRQRSKELAAKQKAAAEKEAKKREDDARKEKEKKKAAEEKEAKKRKAEEEKEKNKPKYGHTKKGAYFDGKWYDGDFSYLEKKKYGYNDYAKYLKKLSASERYLFFTSNSREWKTRRWQVQYNLPEVDYNDLYAEFMPSGDTSKHKPTRRPTSKKWKIMSY